MSKEYFRKYYKNKYHTDAEYREKHKKLANKNYVRKTKTCEKCTKQLPLTFYHDICFDCRNIL